MSTHWTELLKDISEVARQSLHNLVINNTPPLPQCYEREFLEVASDLKKHAILHEILTDQDQAQNRLKTIINSAAHTFEDAGTILQEFETDAQQSLALLEREFSDINEFVKKIDARKSEKLDRNVDSFLDTGNEYAKRIAAAMLDIEKYHEKLIRLTKEMDQDHLTGVYNRRTWEHDIMDITGAANRDADTDKGFSIAMMDIDHFKTINDEHGHPIGDAILKQFGAMLKNHFTATGSVYRYGGDEFAAIMPGMDIKEAEAHIEALQRQVEKTVFLTRKKKIRINITTSCGISTWKPSHLPQDIVDSADKALYDAKHAGRNCIKTA